MSGMWAAAQANGLQSYFTTLALFFLGWRYGKYWLVTGLCPGSGPIPPALAVSS